LDRLDIRQGRFGSRFASSLPGRVENAQWLDLLRPFAAVKNLHLTKPLELSVMSALGELTEEVLPALQNIFLEELRLSEPLQEAIGHFVAARELSGHTVTFHHWKGLPDWWRSR
jgi:hypothetical protein